jgi:hypothetical protein
MAYYSIPPGEYWVKKLEDGIVYAIDKENVFMRYPVPDSWFPHTKARTGKLPESFTVGKPERCKNLERRTKSMFNVLEQLKTFNESSSIEALVELSAAGRAVECEFAELKVAAPEQLTSGLKTLRKVIASKVQDKIERDLKSLQAQFESMQTLESKRAKVAEQIAALQAQLEGK